MIINNLRIENFKSHSKTSIDFNTGISIIMGENGAGKSTILEAISFALFKQHSSRSLQNLVHSGSTKMKAQLDFMVNNRLYRVIRERGKTTSQASLYLKEGDNFHKIVSGDKLVNMEIQNILEMDGDLFLNAVYVRQGEIADLIEKTQSEKKQLIGKLLGIESLEKAWKNMASLIKDYEAQKENFKGRLESMGNLQDKIKENNVKKNKIQGQIGDIQSKIKEIITQLEKIKKEKDEMDNQYVIYNQIQSEISIKKGLLTSAESRQIELKSEINKIIDQEKQMEKIEPQLNRLPDLNRFKDLISDTYTLKKDKNRIEELVTKIKSFESILSNNQPYFEEYKVIQDKILDISKERSHFAGAHDLMESKKSTQKNLQKKITKLKSEIESSFDTANNALDSDFNKWEDLEKHLLKIKKAVDLKIKSLDLEITDIHRQISSLEGLNQSIKKPLKELESVEGQCPVCKSDIDESKKNELLTGYLGEMDDNTGKINKLKFSLQGMEKEKEIMESKSKIIQAINVDVLKEKSKLIDLSIKELDEIEMEMEKLSSNVSKLEEIDANLSSKNSRLKEITDQYNQYIKAQGALDSAEDSKILQESLNSILKQIDFNNNEILKLKSSSGVHSEDIHKIEEEIKRITELNNQYQQMKGSIDQKESKIETLKKVDSSIKESKKCIETFTQSLENLPYNAEIHQKLIKSFETKNQEFLEENGNEKELNGILKGIIENINQFQEELDKYQQYKAELSSTNDFIKLLNIFRDLYGKDGIQKDLRNMSRPIIEENTRDFFEKFNFDYSDITLDEDYNIDVYGPLGNTSLDMISGGERIAVALALRLGITRALSGGNLELIMLDEPTIHLDSYRRQELIEILKKMSIIPQMIIVTHDSDLEEAADNIIKVQKEKGNSQIFIETA
ncbi:AAA family ATPase [Methanobacterium alcaliphilum]|uniref:AAA family ATPase n=1 Tax=Methanobacterium alcaliphilum TaxID=392018 RepID=UPI00200AB7C0|nr:SMC family ATPase [Methanobacterium alcaliphilum]MCK9151703.1 SMC family ATPase [Methanobacterium alcaliphilum]